MPRPVVEGRELEGEVAGQKEGGVVDILRLVCEGIGGYCPVSCVLTKRLNRRFQNP